MTNYTILYKHDGKGTRNVWGRVYFISVFYILGAFYIKTELFHSCFSVEYSHLLRAYFFISYRAPAHQRV